MRRVLVSRDGLSALKVLVLPLAAAASMAAAPVKAATTTIDFSDQTPGFSPLPGPLTYPDLVFSSDNGLRIFSFSGSVSLDRALCPHGTNACRSALTIDVLHDITSLSFDLYQVDLANRSLSVATTSAAGTTTQTIALTKGWNVNTISLSGLTGVTRLVLDGTSDEEGVIYDNFRFETVATGGTGGSPAPEPAAWALMLAGFGLAGAALRRRSALASAGA